MRHDENGIVPTVNFYRVRIAFLLTRAPKEDVVKEIESIIAWWKENRPALDTETPKP